MIMKSHPHLIQAKKILSHRFYVNFIDKNICIVALDKKTQPFAHLVVEQASFDGIGLSLAFDYDDTFAVAELVISLMHVAPVALADPFYQSKSGDLYWNDAALEQYQLECDSDILKDLPPVSNSVN